MIIEITYILIGLGVHVGLTAQGKTNILLNLFWAVFWPLAMGIFIVDRNNGGGE